MLYLQNWTKVYEETWSFNYEFIWGLLLPNVEQTAYKIKTVDNTHIPCHLKSEVIMMLWTWF